MLSKSTKLGYVKSNPTYLVEFPLDKVKEKTNKEKKLEFYTLEQENLFLDTARNFDDFMWYVFFNHFRLRLAERRSNGLTMV